MGEVVGMKEGEEAPREVLESVAVEEGEGTSQVKKMSRTPQSTLRLATYGFHLVSRTKPQGHPMAGKLGAAGGLTLTSRACPPRMNNRRSTSSIAGTCERDKRERLQRRTPRRR